MALHKWHNRITYSCLQRFHEELLQWQHTARMGIDKVAVSVRNFELVLLNN